MRRARCAQTCLPSLCLAAACAPRSFRRWRALAAGGQKVRRRCGGYRACTPRGPPRTADASRFRENARGAGACRAREAGEISAEVCLSRLLSLRPFRRALPRPATSTQCQRACGSPLQQPILLRKQRRVVSSLGRSHGEAAAATARPPLPDSHPRLHTNACAGRSPQRRPRSRSTSSPHLRHSHSTLSRTGVAPLRLTPQRTHVFGSCRASDTAA
jgi:hypothetical protein